MICPRSLRDCKDCNYVMQSNLRLPLRLVGSDIAKLLWPVNKASLGPRMF